MGVCVHCAVHGQHGLDESFGGLWVGLVHVDICFTDWWVSPFLGCCLFVVLVVLARGLHPVSFPNLEVKPFCADGTATGGLWESRALPTVFLWWGCLVLLWGRRPHHSFVCVEGVPPLIRPEFRVVCWGWGPFMRLGDRHRCLRSSQYINLTLSA